MKPETIAAQALGWIDAATGAISPPIAMSTTFERDPDNAYSTGRAYVRADNPAFDQPERVLAALEGGAAAMLFSSGMAAASACFLSLRSGDHVVFPKVMYWGLRRWILDFARDFGLAFDAVDTTRPEALADALQPGRTKLVWIETPANPTWEVTDIAAAAELAHEAGALLAVDSTVATPALTRPLALGADIVMHSATKYLNGHSDLAMGALVAATESDAWARLRDVRSHQGAIPGSFEAWLLLRGMRTLFPRVRLASANAMTLAERFDGDRRLEAVIYPGLAGHPGHEIAARQMTGAFGGMLSIRVKGGAEAAIAAAAKVKVFKRATSLGGPESLIEHRASVEGEGSPAPADLLRLSAGLEDVEDLFSDLDQALG
ncbi:MAG TPA: PLP-dependent aspartate aminotransferase family protein [Caulobacteraceae bacterium]|nr:PLP-dependent aspartate aminotransferase family protein [Caulobacteraceae bacterium]